MITYWLEVFGVIVVVFVWVLASAAAISDTVVNGAPWWLGALGLLGFAALTTTAFVLIT